MLIILFKCFAADVQLKANSTKEIWPYIENVATKERPLIVHGNGPSKLTLNHFGNYLAKAWSISEGCALCKEKRVEYKVWVILHTSYTYCIFMNC